MPLRRLAYRGVGLLPDDSAGTSDSGSGVFRPKSVHCALQKPEQASCPPRVSTAQALAILIRKCPREKRLAVAASLSWPFFLYAPTASGGGGGATWKLLPPSPSLRLNLQGAPNLIFHPEERWVQTVEPRTCHRETQDETTHAFDLRHSP